MHACGVIKFIWLVEGEVIHFMLGDIAIQFSVFAGSGAGGFIVYCLFSLLHIVVQQHLLSFRQSLGSVGH